MSTPAPGRFVVPSPRIPKTLGMLHIIFASLLLMCSLCMGFYVAILPALSKGMTEITKKAEDQVKAQRQAALKSLEEQEKAAETEQEKAELRQRRLELEAQKDVPMF